jgi:hypothetical protein
MRMRVVLALAAITSAWGAPPHIFFADLESGPNSGGQNNSGVFVTIRGRHFGTVRGQSIITIGGGPASTYALWTDSRVVFQLGAAAKSGSIQVNTEHGSSNLIAFRLRPGGIYYVAKSGSDGANGSFSTPWKTITKARDASRPGDTIYVMDGVQQTTDDGYGWSATLTFHADSGGTAAAPKALIAYPGATVTIGSVSGPRFGIRTTGPPGFWTIAGMVLRGSVTAVHTDGPSTNWHFINNDMSCPHNTTGSCFSTSKTSNVHFLGNNVHDVGEPNASALNHGVYFSTDSNHLDVGWNTIANVRGCRGLQIHSTVIETGSGHNQYDISIHDNVIHDTQCDGIVLATIDPSKGKVEVWNNLIYNAGQGPNNPEKTGHWSCILVSGYTNAGPPGGGTAEVYNNTLYHCGSFAQTPYSNVRSGIANAGRNQNLLIRIRNNIIVPAAGVPYLTMWDVASLCSRSDCKGIYGTNNLFFGSGRTPSVDGLQASMSADPLFANAAQSDFHLTSQSAACRAGVDTGAQFDQEGNPRRKETGYALGALQCP